MESKLINGFPCCVNGLLLIEPVWNRNNCSGRIVVVRGLLLIEPVWNRNASGVAAAATTIVTFNRTVWNRNRSAHRWIDNRLSLLIEPFWNRNCVA